MSSNSDLIKLARRVKIKTAGDLLKARKSLPKVDRPRWWLFCGTPRGYPLKTSLERILDDRNVSPKSRPKYERQLLKDFKRRAHHHLDLLPTRGDLMGWLALMQHYGAPTRLLDWTYSFYIAAYFALVATTSTDTAPCIVWALYRDDFKLKPQTKKAERAYEKARSETSPGHDVLRTDSDNLYDGINAFLRSVMSKPEKCVWAVNSFRLNERQSNQQGVFLCPGDIRCSFEDNLRNAKPSRKNLVRFEISTKRKARREMITTLHEMNINDESLFPGLQGFARSLRAKLWVPGSLRPKRPTIE